MIACLFEIISKHSDRCRKRFFVEREEIYDAWVVAREKFPNEKLELIGVYYPEDAKAFGYDVY